MNDFDNKQICSYKDIDRFGFTCDVCGRKVNGCHYINGMKFCAKCYQETFGKDNQQNEIQQLKQQLTEKQNTIDEINKEFVQAVHDWKTLCAEKDKEIAHLKEMDNYHLRYELAGADETIEKIKKQLEEKDKEIERLKFFEKAYYYNQLQASQEDIQKFQNLANQGAVNINYIAIQELEKLRNDIWELDIGDYYLQNGGTIENIKVKRKDVCDLINNQIKELKGE